MAASSAAARQPRRGPAPIASFDHEGSDESSPEGKLTARLPEIREGLAPPEPRARSHSSPAAGALAAPSAPRIDISRASSSSHHDSRDSSPELALFAGGGGDRARLELGFREDGALELRSSTEELAFLEPAPGEPPAPPAAPPPPPPPAERRHSRKDSQSSEAALLAVSGRTSRISSVGSQCSAHSALSALSRVSRLSVVSGASRSPSPHRMLLETSFCGPKPIETDPEISAGELVEQILGIVTLGGIDAALSASATPATSPPAPASAISPAHNGTLPSVNVAPSAPVDALPPAPIDARDRREVRTEVTVESARSAPVTAAVTIAAPPPAPPPDPPAPASVDTEKNEKETKNRTRSAERQARPRLRREPSEPEVYKSRNKSKDIIRIKLRPDDSCEEEEECGAGEAARKPATLELAHAARPAPPSPTPSRPRSPSPAGAPVSRKSSFCSLFKSRETIASPESPSEALRRKRSLTEGRSRSKSRDRSATPTSATKIRGSVLSLFRTPRRGGASPAGGSREGSPVVQGARPLAAPPAPHDRRRADRLKYYEDTKDGIIHIPLRTPPDERAGPPRRSSGGERAPPPPRDPRPASAPQQRAPPDPPPPAKPEPLSRAQPEPQPPSDSSVRAKPEPRPPSSRAPSKPIHRTVLPDGSIIIPLHSPTERAPEAEFPEIVRVEETTTIPKRVKEPITFPEPAEETKTMANRSATSTAAGTPTRAGEGGGATSDSSPQGRGDSAHAGTPDSGAAPEPVEDSRRRRKKRLVFTTNVGSREQVFSTQFSITKTPSVTSEISGSFPSFGEGSETPATLRDSRIGASPPAASPGAATPEAPRDSSESEASSEAAPSHAGNDVEKRGLVVQESFEEELPYVPTTLPQERSVALPMVPVRERGGVRVSGVQRPRAAAPPPARTATPPAPAPAAADKLRIKLPRRPRPAPAPAAGERSRARTDSGGESRSKAEWIDFEEVPERRKQPKRIQTLPAGAVSDAGGAGGVVFSYVDPEHCRCECHAHARADDQLPLLRDDMQTSVISSSSAECGDSEPASQAEAAGPAPGPERGAPGS